MKRVTVMRAAGRHLGMRRTEFGRWGVTGQHVVVATLCVLVLVVIVAWWALRSVPHAESVTVGSSRILPSGSDSPAGPTPGYETVPGGAGSSIALPVASGSPSLSSRLVVDVAGKVRRPGIVELPAGSRVVDAIAAAGGARARVFLTSLNLARVLVDGEQIVVGIDIPVVGEVPPTGTVDGSTPGMITPVALNTATAEQLDTLPGIGPVTAQAILQWRADNGPFLNVDDLLAVSGIGDATMSDVRPYVYV